MTKTKDLTFKNHHRWGFKDSYFCIEDKQVVFKSPRVAYSFFANKPLPNFLKYVFENIGLDLTKEQPKVETPITKIVKSKVSEPFLKSLKNFLKASQISTDLTDRLVHSHGQTTSEEVYKVLYEGKLDRFIDLVVFCHSEQDVQKIISTCLKHKVCLVPYGGGTSVSGALILPKKETRPIVALNMREMNKIENINLKNMTACIQTGITGKELEEQLNEKGLTIGHEPDSIEFSTLGGWISTNASGMKKNRYGNIEDIVHNFNLITPSGNLQQIGTFDRTSIGMQPTKLFFGSEGNLGVITKATVKIHKQVEQRKYASVIFKNMKLGTQFLREVSQQSLKPASIRLVDNPQFRFGIALRPENKGLKNKLISKIQKFVLLKLKGMDPEKMCLTTIVMEGSKAEVLHLQKYLVPLAKKYQGVQGGEHNGKRGYLLTNVIAYIRDFLGDYHCIGETLETTVPWDKIEAVSQAAHKALIKEHKKHNLPGKPYFSYRITQLYHSSVCIYIMLGLGAKNIKNAGDLYTKIEGEVRQAILKNGGSLSHHHGVGKLRKQFIPQTLSENNIEILQSIKKQVDPKNIFGIQNNIFYKN